MKKLLIIITIVLFFRCEQNYCVECTTYTETIGPIKQIDKFDEMACGSDEDIQKYIEDWTYEKEIIIDGVNLTEKAYTKCE